MKKSKTQVQGTNDFNTVSKCSMIKNGYFRDKFVSHFVTKCGRRTPLIHLGYYMRVLTVDFTLRAFLDAALKYPLQVISLGAGFDTSFFRFADAGILDPEVYFYEIDFDEVVERKVQCILRSSQLQECIGGLQVNPPHVKGLVGSQYRLVASDLQDLHKLESNLKTVGVKFDIPTLLLAECAICYMDEKSASQLIEWAALKFEDSTFVTYEQVYPDDGFGAVMMKHFGSMNSPLLSLYKHPHLETQELRYTSRGWSSCKSWTAYEMFLKITTPDERRNIVTLEPFDEFEEWHLEGCHFSLLIASKGKLTDWFQECTIIPVQRDNCHEQRKVLQWEQLTPTVCRFAHQTVKLTKQNGCDILIIGGFGPSPNSLHGRRHEVLKIRIGDEKALSICSVEEVTLGTEIKLDALHHSCTKLSHQALDGSTRILLTGGRYSPCKPVNVWPVILNIRQCGQEITTMIDKSVALGDVPVPRWRHSALCFCDTTHDHVVVFGGRTTELKVLDEVVIWTVDSVDGSVNWKEIKHKPEDLWPPARFSHSTTVWHDRTMVVTGGLGSDLLPLRDLWFFSTSLQTWQEVPVSGMLPRYSHTSAVRGDDLILVGGVNVLPGQQPGVCVLNLVTGSCIEYALPMQDPVSPIMLHNHTSEIVEDSLVIIGGGGNCFSFGTEFNHCIIKIDLNQFR